MTTSISHAEPVVGRRRTTAITAILLAGLGLRIVIGATSAPFTDPAALTLGLVLAIGASMLVHRVRPIARVLVVILLAATALAVVPDVTRTVRFGHARPSFERTADDLLDMPWRQPPARLGTYELDDAHVDDRGGVYLLRSTSWFGIEGFARLPAGPAGDRTGPYAELEHRRLTGDWYVVRGVLRW